MLPSFADDAKHLGFLLMMAFGSLGKNKKSIPECHTCPAGIGVGGGRGSARWVFDKDKSVLRLRDVACGAWGGR